MGLLLIDPFHGTCDSDEFLLGNGMSKVQECLLLMSCASCLSLALCREMSCACTLCDSFKVGKKKMRKKRKDLKPLSMREDLLRQF